MTNETSDQMPTTIVSYFATTAARDDDAMLALFTDDAVVTDEGVTRIGRNAILDWRRGVASAFTYTIELIGHTTVGRLDGLDGHDVTGHLVGDFPGSPVDLVFRFGLRGGQIGVLTIAP